MPSEDIDSIIRQSAFALLRMLADQYGDPVPRQALSEGFDFHGTRVPLLGPQGIFKPRLLELPLSITTAPNRPYNDTITDQEILRYRYRGNDPEHRDNVGLRRVMQARKPLIYLHGVVSGKYLPVWPVYIIEDDPAALTFTVTLDDRAIFTPAPLAAVHQPANDGLRRYATATVRVRLHQCLFRERVLHAYRTQCALCRLRHATLLDAAHIIPDNDPGGEPLVANGLALCKLHHAAFDQNILGIRPDYTAEIRMDVLKEIDGPMLKHGLQEMHRKKIWVPRRADARPDPNALGQRYEIFRAAH